MSAWNSTTRAEPHRLRGLRPGLHPPPWDQWVAQPGPGLGVLHNDIHNAMNPREGLYSEWAFLRYGAGQGSEFKFTSTSSTTGSTGQSRRIRSSPRSSTASSRRARPVQHAGLMGGESLMRGYLGRYRDQNLLAAQVEYRILPFSFSKRIGAAPSSPPVRSTATTTRSPGSTSCPRRGRPPLPHLPREGHLHAPRRRLHPRGPRRLLLHRRGF